MHKEYLEVQFLDGSEVRYEIDDRKRAMSAVETDIKSFMKENFPGKSYEIANINEEEYLAVNTMSMELFCSIFVTPIMVKEDE